MNCRWIIALFMGLVFQLSQVPTCFANAGSDSCATSTRPMSCCEGLESCPCAVESDSDQKPEPLALATVDLKLPLSKAPESDPLAALISPPDPVRLPATATFELGCGFSGVPLTVAFCRFLI